MKHTQYHFSQPDKALQVTLAVPLMNFDNRIWQTGSETQLACVWVPRVETQLACVSEGRGICTHESNKG